jgi:hypothetical protein
MNDRLRQELKLLRQTLADHPAGERIEPGLEGQIVEVLRESGLNPGEALGPEWTRIQRSQQATMCAALAEAPSANGADTKVPGKSPETVRRANSVSTPPQAASEWVPFPTDALPAVLSRYVHEAARALDCDESFLALPLLSMAGGCVGTTRVVVVKRGSHREAPIIWSVIVAASGTKKSPAMDEVLKPLYRAEDAALQDHQSDLKGHELEILSYDRELKEWKKGKSSARTPPRKPERPEPRRYVVSDTTVEALGPILSANPRGVTLARDELAGWVGSFDRYAARGGSDAPSWLQCWSARPLRVDRRGSGPIRVPMAAVSVSGTIQPGTLRRVMTDALRESGLLARLLVTEPPRRRHRWTDADIAPETAKALSRIVDALLALEHTHDPDGNLVAVDVPLSEPARDTFKEWYDRHAGETFEADDELASALAKIEAYVLRFALLFELVEAAARGERASTVGVEAMRSAIVLADWFSREADNVYARLAESPDESGLRALEDWIRRRGGAATVADLARSGARRYRNGNAAQEALDRLAETGRGVWEDHHPPRGRPTRRLRLRGVEI